MSAARYWTPKEEQSLRDYYPTATRADLSRIFPDRPLRAVAVKACKLRISKRPEFKECGIPFDSSVIGHLSESEKGYLAGIMDGEGTISFCRKRNTSGRYVYRLTVSIANTSCNLLTWLKESLPGSAHFIRPDGHNHYGKKPCYHWILSGNRQCLVFLRELSPYMVIKQRQAQLMGTGYVHLSDEDRDSLFTELRDHKQFN